MDDIAAFIEGMPKAELHPTHRGDSRTGAQVRSWPVETESTFPTTRSEEVVAAYNFDSLTTFLVGYYEGMGVLQQEQDFYDLAMAYFRKAHSQNLRYAEIFFDPQGHTSRGVQFETVITGLHRARNDAATDLGLDVQLIMCFLRDMSAESAAETLAQAAPYKDRIVGIGLDSDERGNPPVKFTDVYADAKDQGYHLTMHCDVDQDNTVDHIWQALDVIGVEPSRPRCQFPGRSSPDPGPGQPQYRLDGVPGLEHLRGPGLALYRSQANAGSRHQGNRELRRPCVLSCVYDREPQDRAVGRQPQQGRSRTARPEHVRHQVGRVTTRSSRTSPISRSTRRPTSDAP